MHTGPIQPLEERRDLSGREAHHAILDLRPAERPLLKPLGHENHTCAIPEDQLDTSKNPAVGAVEVSR
jgi:hypothetical protein